MFLEENFLRLQVLYGLSIFLKSGSLLRLFSAFGGPVSWVKCTVQKFRRLVYINKDDFLQAFS